MDNRLAEARNIVKNMRSTRVGQLGGFFEKQGVKTNLDYVLGAGGRVARSKLFATRPDGYMMMTESAPGAAIDEVIGRASYKAIDFTAVYGWSVIGWQLCVNKDSPKTRFTSTNCIAGCWMTSSALTPTR